MFEDMFKAMEDGTRPIEDFYDGYVVNAIMDASYRSVASKKWEPVELEVWRGREDVPKITQLTDYDEQYYLVKEEKMPDGSKKLILKDKKTGKIIQQAAWAQTVTSVSWLM